MLSTNMFILLCQFLVQSQYIEDEIELDITTETSLPVKDTSIINESFKTNPDFSLECIMLFVIGLFIANMYIGNKKNERIATT